MALVVFNGTAMRGHRAHAKLADAAFLEEVRTAPAYRLWSIGYRHPAMLCDDGLGVSISAALCEVPEGPWPAIRDTEPPGLYRRPVELDDGRRGEGTLDEPEFVAGARGGRGLPPRWPA